MNPYTQQAFATVARKLDDLMLPPANVPPSVTKAYQHAKSAIVWAGRRNPHNSR